MDELEARTQQELSGIIAELTALTGLPSRWSGRVELVPNAEFKGQKRPICDIRIDAALAAKDERWSTLIHEALHSISAGYNSNDFRDFRGWEEGVVEQLQRLFRPMIFTRLGVDLAAEIFYPAEEAHPFNRYIAAIEALRLSLLKNAPFGRTQQEFYLDLLAVPIRERPDSIIHIAFAMEQPQRGLFLSTFSRANSTLKLRTL